MKITGRVRKLEAVIKPGECRACGDRTLGLVYGRPHPGPVMFCGLECPPVPCPRCGRFPNIVLNIGPPREDHGYRPGGPR